MTRCLNCGAERAADVCEACGLGTSAAEFSLRKRLLNRTAVFVLGSLAFVVASERYPSLELDGILIFIGVIFFLTLGLAILVERRALKHAEVEALKRIYYGLIPVPWVLSVLLLANGALDKGAPQIIQEQVVSKFAMPGPVPNRRLIVTSWRDGHRFERVAVGREDFDGFNRGDAIRIEVKDGLLDIPWVSGVSHP
ncbi:MAG TPA: hypothetical protein VMB02_17150 [Candidatus Aquilonibacter sp.]|nr:hypothetical protein [Candidatus Aquilonibacter sp.]